MITAYFDGACNNKLPNPPMGYGFVVYLDGVEVYSEYKQSKKDRGTSNQAEWLALCSLLTYCREVLEPGTEIKVFGDSQVIVRQFNVEYKTSGELLAFLNYLRN